MIVAWLNAFLLTQLVEAPIYARAFGDRRRRWLIALGASALTHPFIFLVLPDLWRGGWLSYVLAAEAIAICVEAVWLQMFGMRRAMLIALLANALSTTIGLTLRELFGWP